MLTFFLLLFSKLLSFLSLQAPTTEKLPVLYLVDSIVKNIGGEYLAVFAKNLITSFICVFEKVQLFLLSFNILALLRNVIHLFYFGFLLMWSALYPCAFSIM